LGGRTGHSEIPDCEQRHESLRNPPAAAGVIVPAPTDGKQARLKTLKSAKFRFALTGLCKKIKKMRPPADSALTDMLSSLC
jgi:hypothetical protein